MVSTMAATSLSALNLSVASPAAGVPVRAPATPRLLNNSSNADSSIGSSVAPSEMTTPPRRRPLTAAATALPPEAVTNTTLRATTLLERLGDIRDGAVDVTVRTQFLRQLVLVVAAAIDRDHLESHVASVLHAKVTKPADPKHRDQVSRPCRRISQRAEGR